MLDVYWLFSGTHTSEDQKQYFKIIDHVSINHQSNDVASQYHTGIYYVDAQDLKIILEIKQQVSAKYDKPLSNFYLAE